MTTAPADRSESHATSMPAVGARARRSRQVTSADIERFTAMTGDRNPVHYDPDIARARSRRDKPVTRLRTTITDDDGVVVLDGEAVVWRDPAVAARTETAADHADHAEDTADLTGVRRAAVRP